MAEGLYDTMVSIPCPGTDIASYLQSNATAYGSSKWAELARCPEAHHLKYSDGIVPIGDAPAHFGIGSVVHAAQAWQLAGMGQWRDVIEYLRVRQTHLADGAITDSEVVEKSEWLLDCYYTHWGEDGGWGSDTRVVAVEHEMVGAIGGEFYSVKADHIRELDGRIVVVDTKTSSRIPDGTDRVGSSLQGLEEYRRQIATRPQFLGLSWLTGELFNGGEPLTLIDDLIVKTKVPAFARVEITFTREQIEAWQCAHSLLLQVPRRRNMHACAPGYIRRCQYFDWCHGTEEMKSSWFERKEQ